MANFKCILGTAVLFTFCMWTEGVALRNPETDEQHELTTSDRLELAHKDLDGDTVTGDGDSGAFRRFRRNADPCVRTDCKWPMSSDGNVYVPFKIDNNYSLKARKLIGSAMVKFSQSTCVRFKRRTNETDYLHIRRLDKCSSYVGRQGGAQTLKLKYPDCFTIGTIQHELLHALGFHHEQSRSDRDRHVRVLWENIKEDNKHNFRRVNTENLGTPYDYSSIMHYTRFSGSKNKKPTLKAWPLPVAFRTSTEMSRTDIDRVNRLYCVD